jgi:hypothetical protein
VLSLQAGECLDAMLEVLTAVSRLPWEPQQAGQGSGSSSFTSSGSGASSSGSSSSSDDGTHAALTSHEEEAAMVGAAWRAMCQPVAAAVEACIRTAGQVAAAAGGAPKHLVQRHPSAVALGSCLAALCAPYGRAGPLVAAAAAAPAGAAEQRQLFALLASEVKVLLLDPGSKKASLIAMHPIEQVCGCGACACACALRGAVLCMHAQGPRVTLRVCCWSADAHSDVCACALCFTRRRRHCLSSGTWVPGRQQEPQEQHAMPSQAPRCHGCCCWRASSRCAASCCASCC